MSLQAIISQLSRALEHPPPTNPLAFPTTEEIDGTSIDFDNAIEYARRSLLPNGNLSSAAILDSRPQDQLMFDNRNGCATDHRTGVVGSRAAAGNDNGMMGFSMNNMARFQLSDDLNGTDNINNATGKPRRTPSDKSRNKREWTTSMNIDSMSTDVPSEPLERRRTRSSSNAIADASEVPTVVTIGKEDERQAMRMISEQQLRLQRKLYVVNQGPLYSLQ